MKPGDKVRLYGGSLVHRVAIVRGPDKDERARRLKTDVFWLDCDRRSVKFGRVHEGDAAFEPPRRGRKPYPMCEVCARHKDGPTERLFRFIGDLGRLHVDAETDLRAAAMVWVANSRGYEVRESVCHWTMKVCEDRVLRLADEAVGLGVDRG